MLNSEGARKALPAAAAILVLIAVTAVEVRLQPAPGWSLLLFLVAAVIVVPWAVTAAAAESGGELSGLTLTLILVSLGITLGVMLSVLDALKMDGSGGVLVASLIFAAAAGYPGWRLGSPVCALLSSLALGAAVFALYDLLFGVASENAYRGILVFLFLAYIAAAAALLKVRPRYAVMHVVAAGFMVHGLIVVLAADLISALIGNLLLGGPGELAPRPVGWELIAVLGGAVVLAIGVWLRAASASLVGVTTLGPAVMLTALETTGRSLIGWPLVFIVLAAAAVAGVFLTGGAGLPNLSRRPPAPRRPGGSAASAGSQRQGPGESAARRPSAEERPPSSPRETRTAAGEPPAGDEPARRGGTGGPPPPPPPGRERRPPGPE